MRLPASLPDDVIDRLFSALTVRYGAPFLDRWRDLDLAVVKGDWARELSGFGRNLEALRYALDHLPDKPPNVIEFRKIANNGPAPTVQEGKRIEHTPMTPEEVAASQARARREIERARGLVRMWRGQDAAKSTEAGS